MKALRRSIKGEKNEPKVAHISQKSATAIVPPKKVIRAVYNYEAQSAQELSFQKGDFFHVIARENDTDWYEACNPAIPDARGLVPVTFFEIIGKTSRDSGQSNNSISNPRSPDNDSGYGDSSGTLVESKQRQSKTGKGSGAMVYGVVMYDFAAERPDELEAQQGEAIIVIAQSNPEWFVAKPIGRLGGPGLIPVSFIEIRDMVTGKAVLDPQEAVQRAGVPKVEEWKKMAADYKNSSITLGKFESTPAQQQAMEQGIDRMSLQQGQRQSQNQVNGHYQLRQSQGGGFQQQIQPFQQNYSSKQSSRLYAPISAHIPSFCFAEDKYWFVVEATLEDGRHWELSRYYEDFYDFQIALLTEFPAEAGNTGTQKRTLPYMPGPVNYVTEAITKARQHNLDAYVKNLLTQPPYISRCSLVKQFFAPRDGDVEIFPSTNYEVSQPSSGGTPPDTASRQSSRGNLNGNGYGGLSAAPARQPPPNGVQGQSQYPVDQESQHFSLSQPISQAPNNSLQNRTKCKIKYRFNGEFKNIGYEGQMNFKDIEIFFRLRLEIPNEPLMFSYILYLKSLDNPEKPKKIEKRLLNDDDLNIARNHGPLVIGIELGIWPSDDESKSDTRVY